MDRAERNRLWSSYNNKKLEIERNYGALKKTLLGEREQEDQKWINDFCNLADEQSELTIHVAPPTAISTPTSTARYPPLDEQIPNTQPSVSAASAQFESQTKAGEQIFRGLRTGASQTPQTRVRESSVTLNKRPMLDSNGQDNTPPGLRRVFSGSGPVQERDTFRLSSSPAPFMSLSGPVTLSIGSPTSLVQSTKRTTQPSTPKPNRHQPISASNTPDGTIKLHSIPVESQSGSFLQSTAFTTPDRSRINTSSKTASQSHTFSPSTPKSSSRTSPSLNSSSSSPSAGLTKSLSNNFEIVSVGFENIGGGTFSWMHQPNDPTRYYRLRARSFVPVLKQGKSTGNQDWNIPLDRIWSLKYDADSCLVYMKRIKADKNKTGNAGASMWITFNDRRNLDGFLESYLNQRAGGTVGKIGPDDDVPMSLLNLPKRSSEG
ncbi:hypothetical protein WAI453_008291 [Rhynchosporium graminicola]